MPTEHMEPALPEANTNWLTPQKLALLLVVLFAAQLVFWVFYRLVSLDEGWYLWAGKEVYRGRQLYRDFAYTQMPLLPYVYGALQLVFGNGLYVGRILTALFGLTTAMLSATTARRLAGPWARVFVLAFFATTFLATTAYSYTATYGLTACLLAVAFYLALRLSPGTKRTVLVATFLSLAVAVRLSVVVVIMPLGLYVVLTSPKRLRTALEMVATTVLVLGLLVVPFLLTSGQVMLYDILGFHTDRNTPEWHQSAVRDMLRDAVRDLPGPVLGYLVAVAVLIVALVRGKRSAWRTYGFEVAVAVAVFLLFLTHLVPRTTMSYYNTLQVSLVAVLVGALLARLAHRFPRFAAALVVVALVLQVITQIRAVRFYELSTQPPQSQVEIVRRTAQALKKHVPDGGQVLTFDLHLALEGGLEVLPGLEMSIFSYRPTWTTEQAQRYRVLNNAMLLDALEGGVDAVLLTQFDEDLLYGQRDAVFDSLRRNYRLASVVPGFGPLRDDLHIYLPPQQTLPATATAIDRSFGQGVHLSGYEFANEKVQPGQPLTFALYWRAEQSTPQLYTVFTHLVDASEAVVVGYDNPPCRNTCPTTTWQLGEMIRDEYVWQIPEALPAGEYRVQVGMYDSQTLERLPLLDTNGEVVGDQLILAVLDCQPGSSREPMRCLIDKPAQ